MRVRPVIVWMHCGGFSTSMTLRDAVELRPSDRDSHQHGERLAEIVAAQINVEGESPPAGEYGQRRENDGLVDHVEIDELLDLARDSTAGEVGIARGLVQNKRE